uniref:uncharacterized protein LOC120343142 n=1 Tax=Styela clava TaxID=7725 RepID=UPI00193A4FE7|nr:uncharacterized protein LOC120343142 [Styela clava]
MAKYILLSLAFLFLLRHTSAQTSGNATAASAPSFAGLVNAILASGRLQQSISGSKTCLTGENDNFKEVRCPSQKGNCLTKIVYNHDLVHVMRECKEEEPCKNLQSQNRIQCRGPQAKRNQMACHTKITFTNGYTGLHENAEVESQCMAVNKCLELGRQNVEACKTAEEQAIEGTVCNYCCFTDGCNNDPYVIERIERGLA